MGVQDVLTRKTGVIVGDDVLRLFEYARENQFAIPAIVRQTEMHDKKDEAKIVLTERHLFLHRRRCS